MSDRTLTLRSTASSSRAGGRDPTMLNIKIKEQSGNTILLENGMVFRIHQVTSHQPGWLLLQDGLCCRSSKNNNDTNNNTNNITKRLRQELDRSSCLQSECLYELSQNLPRYLHEWGPARLHHVLSLLPAESLTALSIHCCNNSTNGNVLVWNDDLAIVLGCHAHVERLVLHAAHMTPQGIERAMYHFPPPAPAAADNEKDILTTVSRMERLELMDATLTLVELRTMLDRLPSLTHLSLSHLTILQCNDDDDNNSEMIHTTPISLQEWESLLVGSLPRRLSVLDVSHCAWLTEPMLQALAFKTTMSLPHLQCVHVAGCPLISHSACFLLNHSSRIRICHARQTWREEDDKND